VNPSACLRLLRRAAGGAALIAALLVTAAPAVASNHFEQAVLNDINSVRASYGLPAVRDDGRMANGARSHSESMARHNFFDHASVNGASWDRRVRRSSGSGTVGEVLGYIQSTGHGEARAIVRAWMHSAEHRAILLSRSFDRAGVGRAWAHWSGHRTAIYTVDFAAG
jgi:uncharacterized protein YkwD